MVILWNIVLLIVGFAMLVKGADWFVDGAAGIASKLKIPQLVKAKLDTRAVVSMRDCYVNFQELLETHSWHIVFVR